MLEGLLSFSLSSSMSPYKRYCGQPGPLFSFTLNSVISLKQTGKDQRKDGNDRDPIQETSVMAPVINAKHFSNSHHPIGRCCATVCGTASERNVRMQSNNELPCVVSALRRGQNKRHQLPWQLGPQAS